MDSLTHGGNRSGSSDQFQGYSKETETATSTSEAVQSGPSSPDTSSSSEEASPDEAYFRGLVYATETDTETGEVTEHRRPCTKVVNPQTGTPNRQFQKRFTKHTEWVTERREYGKEDLFHAVVTLHEEDLDEANLSPDATKSVFAQLTPRLKERLRYRDEEAEVLLSHAERPNSGEWHVHVFVLSKGCTLEQICEVFRVEGADTDIITPFSDAETDEGEEQGPAEFARVTGWYLFQNRIEGAKKGDSGGFSSWKKKGGNAATDGVGYTSMAAKINRRRHAEEQSSPDGGEETGKHGGAEADESGGGSPDEETGEEGSNTGAGSKTENHRNDTEEGKNNGGSAPSHNGGSGDDSTGKAGVTGGSADTATEETESAEEKGRAPPVSVPNDTVGTWRVARRLVLSALSARLNTEVEVENVGRARLTWVEVADNGGVVCTVRPLEKWDDEREKVGWRKVERDGAPIVRQTNPNAMHNNAEEDTADTAEEHTEEAEAFLDNARHCRVGVRLPNGNVREREWENGEKVRDKEVPQ